MNRTRKALAYPLTVDAARGLAAEMSHAEYVEDLIRQILLTRPGERVHRADFGAGIADLVFAPMSRAMSDLARVMVWRALTTHLADYIELELVKVENAIDVLTISVQYVLKSDGTRRFLNQEVVA